MSKVSEFNTWKNHYDPNGYDEQTFADLIKICGNLGSIVEVGCGAGGWTKGLVKQSSEVIAIDFSPRLTKMLNQQHLHNCLVIVGDGENLPVKHSSIDNCCYMLSLHHIPNLKQTLLSASSAIKKGGSIILVEPNGTNCLRQLGYKIGKIINRTGLKLSSPVEKPVRISEVKEILEPLGYEITVRGCDTTTNAYSGRGTFNVRKGMYILFLRLTKKLFPTIYGASDFILVAKKPCD